MKSADYWGASKQAEIAKCNVIQIIFKRTGLFLVVSWVHTKYKTMSFWQEHRCYEQFNSVLPLFFSHK